jgi:branched-chain amino acid transport system ATP-binding protein
MNLNMNSDNTILLSTENLSRYFGGLKAVDGVNLVVRNGDFHSIIGPNGAGKTTLFNLLSGALKPTQGRVFLRGEDITGLPVHRMAHYGIGRSYQVTNIFPTLTVFENVRLAAQALGRDSYKLFSGIDSFGKYAEIAGSAITEAGLAKETHLPALSLNHGAKRKLEVAILLAQDPDLLLLDEPTSGLASEAIPEFMSLIQNIHQTRKKTVLLVEHNMNVVMSLSDRISVMHQGRLLAEGTPAEIAANTEVRTAYLGELFSEPGDQQQPAPGAASQEPAE